MFNFSGYFFQFIQWRGNVFFFDRRGAQNIKYKFCFGKYYQVSFDQPTIFYWSGVGASNVNTYARL